MTLTQVRQNLLPFTSTSTCGIRCNSVEVITGSIRLSETYYINKNKSRSEYVTKTHAFWDANFWKKLNSNITEDLPNEYTGLLILIYSR